MRWSTWFANVLSTGPYAPYVHSGLELHFDPLQLKHLFPSPTPTDAEYEAVVVEWDRRLGEWEGGCDPFTKRIPKNGKTETPIDNDTICEFNPELVLCAGTNWWDWKNKLTIACGIDFDSGHSNDLAEDGIALVDDLATRLPYIMNVTSKGGKGRHWTVFCEPMPAPSRRHHSANCSAIVAQLSKVLGVDLKKLYCSRGGIMYQYHFRPNSEGFRLVKGIS